MRILILSDNHSRSIELDLSKYDYVIHCGDYGSFYDYVKNDSKVLIVRGNCDFEGNKEIFTNIKDRNVLVVHGDLYNVKSHYNTLIYKALSMNANMVFFGHTHRADMFIIENIVFINPGSYQYGEYVEIDDNNIIFYSNDKVFKKYEFRW